MTAACAVYPMNFDRAIQSAHGYEAMFARETFYFCGYTNGCTGYSPTEEEYDKGSYEVYWSMLIIYIYHGRVGPLNRDSAEKLIEAAVDKAPRSWKHNTKQGDERKLWRKYQI
jgi:hypothetical protein